MQGVFICWRGLCHGCLKWGHLCKDCRHGKICSTCNGSHPTLLHDDALAKENQHPTKKIPEATSNYVEASGSKQHSECHSHSLIVPVWLCHEANLHDKELVYALLDHQSDTCFIKDTVLNKLSFSGPEVQLKLLTVLSEEVASYEKLSGLIVQGLTESNSIPPTRNILA